MIIKAVHLRCDGFYWMGTGAVVVWGQIFGLGQIGDGVTQQRKMVFNLLVSVLAALFK